MFVCTAADKEWKRRYFQEKKLTSVIEDNIKKAKSEQQQFQSVVEQKHGPQFRGEYNSSLSTCNCQ